MANTLPQGTELHIYGSYATAASVRELHDPVRIPPSASHMPGGVYALLILQELKVYLRQRGQPANGCATEV